MIIYINNNGEIKDVNNTLDKSLTAITIPEDNNLFNGWTEDKICCYKVEIKDEKIVCATPYVNTDIIDRIDRLSNQNMNTQAQIDYLSMMSGIEM